MILGSEEIKLQLKELCYDVLAYALAEKDMRDLSHPINEWFCIFDNNFREIYPRVFNSKLIMLSAMIRVLLDDNKNVDYKDGNKLGVKEEKNSGIKEDLNLRKCCNKIIHAEKRDMKYELLNEHPLENSKNIYLSRGKNKKFKNILILIEDKYQKKEYRSEINLIKFIEATMNFID